MTTVAIIPALGVPRAYRARISDPSGRAARGAGAPLVADAVLRAGPVITDRPAEIAGDSPTSEAALEHALGRIAESGIRA